jgi:hypothetical protein
MRSEPKRPDAGEQLGELAIEPRHAFHRPESIAGLMPTEHGV